jgi:hypothetical protein
MKSPVLFLGIQPENKEHLQIWQKFMEKNQDTKIKYSVVVIDKFLSADGLENPEILDTKEQVQALLSGFQTALSQGQRVVVIVPNLFGAQVIKGNVVNQIKDGWSKLASPCFLSAPSHFLMWKPPLPRPSVKSLFTWALTSLTGVRVAPSPLVFIKTQKFLCSLITV